MTTRTKVLGLKRLGNIIDVVGAWKTGRPGAASLPTKYNSIINGVLSGVFETPLPLRIVDGQPKLGDLGPSHTKLVGLEIGTGNLTEIAKLNGGLKNLSPPEITVFESMMSKGPDRVVKMNYKQGVSFAKTVEDLGIKTEVPLRSMDEILDSAKQAKMDAKLKTKLDNIQKKGGNVGKTVLTWVAAGIGLSALYGILNNHRKKMEGCFRHYKIGSVVNKCLAKEYTVEGKGNSTFCAHVEDVLPGEEYDDAYDPMNDVCLRACNNSYLNIGDEYENNVNYSCYDVSIWEAIGDWVGGSAGDLIGGAIGGLCEGGLGSGLGGKNLSSSVITIALGIGGIYVGYLGVRAFTRSRRRKRKYDNDEMLE
jgi:hypothetical protein